LATRLIPDIFAAAKVSSRSFTILRHVGDVDIQTGAKLISDLRRTAHDAEKLINPFSCPYSREQPNSPKRNEGPYLLPKIRDPSTPELKNEPQKSVFASKKSVKLRVTTQFFPLTVKRVSVHFAASLNRWVIYCDNVGRPSS